MKYYQTRIQAGDKVILDNGAYEEVMVDERYLFDCVSLLKPTVVVLPDVPNNPKETLKRSETFYKVIRARSPNTESMYVSHSDGTFDGSVASYVNASIQMPGLEWIALSRLTKHYGSDTIRLQGPRRRIQFGNVLQNKGHWRRIKHHALGMLDGNVEELWALKQQGFNSCDSSAPIWRGLNGFSMLDAWPNYEFNPFDLKADNWPQALKNLREVLGACR